MQCVVVILVRNSSIVTHHHNIEWYCFSAIYIRDIGLCIVIVILELEQIDCELKLLFKPYGEFVSTRDLISIYCVILNAMTIFHIIKPFPIEFIDSVFMRYTDMHVCARSSMASVITHMLPESQIQAISSGCLVLFGRFDDY